MIRTFREKEVVFPGEVFIISELSGPGLQPRKRH